MVKPPEIWPEAEMVSLIDGELITSPSSRMGMYSPLWAPVNSPRRASPCSSPVAIWKATTAPPAAGSNCALAEAICSPPTTAG